MRLADSGFIRRFTQWEFTGVPAQFDRIFKIYSSLNHCCGSGLEKRLHSMERVAS